MYVYIQMNTLNNCNKNEDAQSAEPSLHIEIATCILK